MATLSERLIALVEAIGTDIKDLGGGGTKTIIWDETNDDPDEPIPAEHRYIIILMGLNSVPSWAPSGSIIIRV